MATLGSPAAAQSPAPARFEVAGGYQRVQSDDQSFPIGATVGLSHRWGPLSLVGELGWAYDMDDTGSQAITFHWHTWNVGVGPRWEAFGAGRLQPYAQVLAGVLYTRFTSAFTERNPAIPPFGPPDADRSDHTSTDTAFSLQPGVGLDVRIAGNWSAMGQVDYRRLFIEDDDVPEPTVDGATNGENQLRLVVGVRRSF